MVLETLVGTVIGYLASSKGTGQAKDEVSVAMWEWIRPIFLKEEKTEELQRFEEQPADKENQQVMAQTLYAHLQQNQEALAQLQSLVEQTQLKYTNKVGNIINYAPVEKQVNNPNIEGDLNM